MKKEAFKAYDIRGKYPTEIDEEMAYKIGVVFAKIYNPKKVVVGNDIRLSGEKLKKFLINGLIEMGVDVLDIGMCGTENIYFSTSFYNLDGGIMITASHNPKEYNGMKLVSKNSVPIGENTGLKEIAEQVFSPNFKVEKKNKLGKIETKDIMPDYLNKLLSNIDLNKLKPLKIVINAGNGSAGKVMELLKLKLPFHFIEYNMKPDGNFPNGVPNPLLLENREITSKLVLKNKADLGIAWDGDFDRCFLFAEDGTPIEGYYLIGSLAQEFLKKYPKAKIMHDPRLYWDTVELIEEAGGIPFMSRSGHAFMKAKMREEDIIYGGEMSSHHYFKDFYFCDSGMLPWLLITQIMSITGKKISDLIKDRIAKHPISGEINSKVANPQLVIEKIKEKYSSKAVKVETIDGLGINYENWRFNLRMSNTEPLIRLNVESQGDKNLIAEKTAELLKIIRG